MKLDKNMILGLAAGALMQAPAVGIGYYFNQHVIGEANMATHETCTKTPTQCTTLNQWQTSAKVAGQLDLRNQLTMTYLLFMVSGFSAFGAYHMGSLRQSMKNIDEQGKIRFEGMTDRLRVEFQHGRQLDVKDREIERLQAQLRRYSNRKNRPLPIARP